MYTACITSHKELSAMIVSSISVLVTLTTVIAIMVPVALVYFASTRYKRKSRGQLNYDAPYNYELPPLPLRIRRMDSGIYDTISNGSKDGLQDQPRGYAQTESKSLDSKVVSSDSEILAANSCLNNSPLSDENGNTVNDIAISQFPSTNPDTARLSSTRSVGIDSSSERADLPLNLDTDTAENLNDELTRIPSPNVTANVSYQPSTKFSPERNPAYGTNVAIAPEIDTSENIAYEHSESNNTNETVVSQSSITSPDAVVSIVPPPTHSTETDVSLEIVDRADLSSNLEVGEPREDSTAENTNDELRVPSPDVAVNASYQPSTNFNLDRNSAYGTNVAIAPEVETSENTAYEHSNVASPLNYGH